jgi:hypothetical protein
MKYDLEKSVVLDCEVYPNFMLVSFKSVSGSGKVINISVFGYKVPLSKENRKEIHRLLHKYTTFGFNSLNYDQLILAAMVAGWTTTRVYSLSSEIINSNSPGWMIMRKNNLSWLSKANHFDISEPTPGVRVGLKLYGGRMHSQRLQDLPYDPTQPLTEKQASVVTDYCANDLNTTIDLFHRVKDRLKLRLDMSKIYGVNLISKSDAQIAEAVIRKKLNIFKVNSPSPELPIYYKVPKWCQFKGQQLSDTLHDIKTYGFGLSASGSIALPKWLGDRKLEIGQTVYQMGIGGLHSKDKTMSVYANREYDIIDQDVVSYYPSIILNQNLYPKHLGIKFYHAYRKIVRDRLDAKKKGDKLVAESLKIVINGSFGKLGSKWSSFYSPDLLLQVTITGQLALLLLIERLENNGIQVASANTDGIVCRVPKVLRPEYDMICAEWQNDTQFELEATHYRSLHSRDVNNYLAIKSDGSIKGKGVFASDPLAKNPQGEIIADAAAIYLAQGVPVKKTIQECQDIRKFIHVRSVTGGAVWQGDYLGKVVRWVWSSKGHPIEYKKNGNKVASSDDAYPVMQLSGLLPHILYDKYEESAIQLIENTGAKYVQ